MAHVIAFSTQPFVFPTLSMIVNAKTMAQPTYGIIPIVVSRIE